MTNINEISMIAPSPLKLGNKIGLIAPSRKVTHDDLANSVAILEQWGYQIVFGESLYDEHDQFAGKDEDRADDFIRMIFNPEIKAILCARGGYGTVRILENLDPDLIRNNPKWIIGYSDITVLHSYFNKVIGCETIHATMPINLKPNLGANDSWEKLRQLLNGDLIDYGIAANELNKTGKVNGMLVGGNLSVLYSLRGTFCDLDTDDRILFIEDLDEYLYHIDRMMMNLKISGKLKNLKGLIVGAMTEMKDNTIPFGKTAYEIIADAVNDYDYPIAFNFPAGHCEPNLPLILGRDIILDVRQDKVKLAFFDKK
jgi:muramoyltetrapeptide carboxypeptidase